jgi:putative ABC transport system substrate-binding protein
MWCKKRRVYGLFSMRATTQRPAVYWSSSFARDGGLLSYGVDLVDLWRRAASYFDRILRGEKPGDLPVQLPTNFEMVVNRRPPRRSALRCPYRIRLRADEHFGRFGCRA